VQVTDAGGSTASAHASVRVAPAPPPGEPGLSINGGAIATNDPNVTLSVVWPRLAATVLIDNDGGFGPGSQSLPLTPTPSWRLTSSGSDRLPKIVYARFRGAGNDLQTSSDDIILDEQAPKVQGATLAAPGAYERRRFAKRSCA